MHMADALLSPAVGGTMWAISAGVIAHSSRKVRDENDERVVPLMGVLGAFIFAAQMINFTIPVTGSSGHLGGGLLLAILLGPSAAFLTIASVLVVQAFFFADGGLLALGCNIFNLGFFPAFIAYPLIYRNIAGSAPSSTRLSLATVTAAIVALQLGAVAVVVETVASGISALPFTTFAAIMQPIHLAIGIVEGVVTASVISFVRCARPEILRHTPPSCRTGAYPVRTVALGFLVAALLTGGVVSWFASQRPDGLEWAITRVTGQKEMKNSGHAIHKRLAAFQEKYALLPDYSFKHSATAVETTPEQKIQGSKGSGERLATTVSGVGGGVITLFLSLGIALLLKRRPAAR